MFDRLVGAVPHAGAIFDYYMTFDEDETTVADTARWDDLPVGAHVESDEGEELIEHGWEARKDEFQRNLDRPKEALDERSDEDIMCENYSPAPTCTTLLKFVRMESECDCAGGKIDACDSSEIGFAYYIWPAGSIPK